MIWLDYLMRPLTRLAIRRGVLFPELAEQLKRSYVRSAQDEAASSATDSLLSVMTGLQRRDISRLRASQAPEAKPHRQPLAEIISLWWATDAYDPKGIPVQGDGASFSSLARLIRKDVHPRTFLELLKQAEAVEEADGMVRLLARAYQPQHGSDDQLAYLGENVGDHLSTAVSNVLGETDLLDAGVHHAGLSEAAIADLEAHWRRRQHELMIELDQMAQSVPEMESGDRRFRAGAYFHVAETPS